MRTIADILKDPRTHLVDVRTPEEVKETGVEGAENIPLHTVPLHLDQFKAMENDIVVFCRSGARSQQAMNFLKQQGIQNVYNGGGFADVIRARSN